MDDCVGGAKETNQEICTKDREIRDKAGIGERDEYSVQQWQSRDTVK